MWQVPRLPPQHIPLSWAVAALSLAILHITHRVLVEVTHLPSDIQEMAAAQEALTRTIRVAAAAVVVAAAVWAELLEAQELKDMREELPSAATLAQVAAAWEVSDPSTAQDMVAQEVRVLPIQSQEPPQATRQAAAAAVQQARILLLVDPRTQLSLVEMAERQQFPQPQEPPIQDQVEAVSGPRLDLYYQAQAAQALSSSPTPSTNIPTLPTPSAQSQETRPQISASSR